MNYWHGLSSATDKVSIWTSDQNIHCFRCQDYFGTSVLLLLISRWNLFVLRSGEFFYVIPFLHVQEALREFFSDLLLSCSITYICVKWVRDCVSQFGLTRDEMKVYFVASSHIRTRKNSHEVTSFSFSLTSFHCHDEQVNYVKEVNKEKLFVTPVSKYAITRTFCRQEFSMCKILFC
jgi:hypothetical protein